MGLKGLNFYNAIFTKDLGGGGERRDIEKDRRKEGKRILTNG